MFSNDTGNNNKRTDYAGKKSFEKDFAITGIPEK
jgi:hypothetical protein